MCHQGVTTKQRALCAVLTRAACARRNCSCRLVDVVCVMLVVLIAHVDVVAVTYSFRSQFS